jgi:hypothetical protein
VLASNNLSLCPTLASAFDLINLICGAGNQCILNRLSSQSDAPSACNDVVIDTHPDLHRIIKPLKNKLMPSDVRSLSRDARDKRRAEIINRQQKARKSASRRCEVF